MDYTKYVRPYVGALIKRLGLDKKYHCARSGYLYYMNAVGQEIEVKDFVGGYGSLALGHNCKELTEYIKKLLDENIPVHDQLSIKHYTGLLGKYISQEIEAYTGRSYISTFTNTGTETVEAAIKHARIKKLKELDTITDEVHKNLNAISNLLIKGFTPSLMFRGKEYLSFREYKEDILSANQNIIRRITPKLLASEKSYHGKTLSALKATYNEKYKNAFLFKSEKTDTVFFPWNEDFVERTLSSCTTSLYIPEIIANGVVSIREKVVNTCIGIIIEPILGEGGVIVVPPSFLKKLRQLSKSFKVPLILDEIQTGIYRTGAFLHSLSSGIHADYYLIGKSLGGGLVKIGALVIDKEAYDEEFGLLHSSTFAEDEFSSAVSLKALELLKECSHRIEIASRNLFVQLNTLKESYPDIIDDVHGEGLMIGVTFKSFDDSACYPLQFASRSTYFNYLIASYLLNNFNVRVAPTLSSSFTIRIQPGIGVTVQDVNVLTAALENVCEVLQCEDFYKFIEYLLPEEHRRLRPLARFCNGKIETGSSGSITKVGFLGHYINEEHVIVSDPSLSILPLHAIEDFLTTIMEIGTSIIAGTKVIKNFMGNEVEVVFVGLPFTSGMVRKAFEKNAIEPYRKICRRAIEMVGKEYSVHVVGLGQYTSVITNNGTTIPFSDVFITTGNSFTVYIGLQSVFHAIHREDVVKKTDKINIGILGAAGNICSVYAKCCSQFASRIYLKGSDSATGLERTKKSARELLKFIIEKTISQNHVATCFIEERIRSTMLYQSVTNGELELDDIALYSILENELKCDNPIKVVTDLETLKKCNLVIVATNQPVPFLTEEHLSPNTIVYDISVPLNVVNELFVNSKNIKVIVGGVVALPNGETLPVKGYPLEEGTAYACICETILLGLEKFEGNFSFGSITPELVYKIGEIAKKHRFLFFKEKVYSIL